MNMGGEHRVETACCDCGKPIVCSVWDDKDKDKCRCDDCLDAHLAKHCNNVGGHVVSVTGAPKAGMSHTAIALPGHVFTLDDCGRTISSSDWYGTNISGPPKKVVMTIRAPNGNVMAITDKAGGKDISKAIRTWIKTNQY